MKQLPLFLYLALPLSISAQDAPSAIIVDEEVDYITVENSASEATDASATNTSSDTDATIESSPTEDATQEIKEASEAASMESDDQPSEEVALPQQPADFQAPTPSVAVQVKVEATNQIELADSSQTETKLLSPWAPKPMQDAPEGWRYVPVSEELSYSTEILLSSGKQLSINITPYALEPEQSQWVVQVLEPGYQPAQGYQQTESITARLAAATQSLDDAASTLETSIQNLSALVDSLPK